MTTADAPPTGTCLACGSGQRTHWCNATDVEYQSVADRYAYWRCLDCASLSIDPCPVQRLAEIYPPNYYSFTGSAPSLLERFKLAFDRRLLQSILRKFSGGTLAALDIGGGTGWMLNEARRVEPRLKTTVIVDIDAQAQDLAAAAGHRFVASRIEDFSTDQRFDLVLMLNLIEHVADPVAVLAAVGRLLTPQGRILLKTPNHASLDAQLFRQSYWGGLHCPRHWVIFTPASLESAAGRAGLSVERLELTQGAPFWCWSVLAGLARRGWITITARRPMAQHPLAPLLMALFAAFDFLRRPLMGRSGLATSQMFAVLAANKSGQGGPGADSPTQSDAAGTGRKRRQMALSRWENEGGAVWHVIDGDMGSRDLPPEAPRRRPGLDSPSPGGSAGTLKCRLAQ